MRRSLGLLESERGGRLVLTEAAFETEERDWGQRVSWIWKDRHTVGTEVGKREGGDGEDEGEAVGEAIGVGLAESPSVCSVSSLGNKGVKGGTSSTSTSE